MSDKVTERIRRRRERSPAYRMLEKFYSYLAELAEQGQPCPYNRELAKLFSVSATAVDVAFGVLREQKRITTRQVGGNGKRVLIVATGRETPQPPPARR